MSETYIKTRCYSARLPLRTSLRRAVTLMELVIAMAMLTIIFAVVLPQFAVIRNSWDTKQSSAEMLQNGRVLMDHINRNLAKAKQITAVSSSSIDFNDCNNVAWRYNIGAGNYVQFGQPGSMSDLAGPVSSLVFTCYDACDFGTPIATPASVRVVKVDATVTNSASSTRSMSFTTEVYLRSNFQSQEWSDQDIGSVAATGSATVSDCNRTIIGSGVDIWDYTDEFHYVYHALTGDGQMVARVVNMTNTDLWAKAGVMIRETLDTASKHAMMVVTPGNGTAFQRRLSTGGVSTHTAGSVVTAPYWVKLTRRGNTFTGYESADANSWRLVDSDTVSMASNVYIGLCVTSHSDGALCTANFDNVSFLTYNDFNEAKTASDTTTLLILTPPANTGDLLIAAVATDGDTSGSLAPVIPANWTAINVGAWSGQVTLGAWRRFATASEPASHTFSWTGNRGAYGWIMRFSGHNPSNPINTSQSGGQTNITPTSPAVTTTVDSCLILRLGAFDDDYITTDAPGLSGHSPITMDRNAATATVTFVAAGTVAANTAAITPALPAGIAVNDILLLFLETGNETITIPTPNGGTWAEVTNSPQGTGTTGAAGTGTRLTVFWSRYNGTQGAPTTSDSGNHQLGRMIAIRGAVTSGDPWDITAGGVEAVSDTSGSIPGATTTVANTLVVAAIATALPDATGTTNFSLWTNGDLASLTERTDNTTNQGNGGGLGIVTGTKTTAGAYSNTAVTIAAAGSSYKGMMSIAIKPGGTVSGGAGYVRQSFAGSSGQSTFSLTAPSEAQMLTIAIAPDSNKGGVCSGGDIRP